MRSCQTGLSPRDAAFLSLALAAILGQICQAVRVWWNCFFGGTGPGSLPVRSSTYGENLEDDIFAHFHYSSGGDVKAKAFGECRRHFCALARLFPQQRKPQAPLPGLLRKTYQPVDYFACLLLSAGLYGRFQAPRKVDQEKIPFR